MRRKKWVKPYLESEKHYLIKDDSKPYRVNKPIYLELGMGMGDFIAKSAALNSDIVYVGFEKVDTCVAKAIQKFNDNKLDNVYVIMDDIKNLKEYFIKEIDRIYLPFSDPWPKKGHQKRRLSHEGFLELYKDILKDEGEIVLKTDNSPFFDYSIMSFLNHGFILKDFSTDRHREENDDVLTAYEMKFIEEKKAIYYAVFKKQF